MTKTKDVACRIIHKAIGGDEDITSLVDEFNVMPVIDGVNAIVTGVNELMAPPKNIQLKFYDGLTVQLSSLEVEITIFTD